MTSDFWLRLALAALIICSMWNAFGDGQILGWLGDVFDRRLPRALQKPIYACPPCMASVYGTATWFLTGGGVEWWIPFVLALSGLMRLISDNLLKK